MVSPIYKEHEVFFENVRRLVSQELAPKAKEWEKLGHFPDDVFKILGDAGYLGILISEEYGGIGGDTLLAAAWCEAFGELCAMGLVTGVNMHSLVISHAIEKFGTKEAKDKWLPRAVAGTAIGAYAFTEPGAGSDLANIRTKAVRDGSKWIINGAKTFITNGARADFILVLTRTDFEAGHKGFTTFLLDTKSPGFKVNRKLDKLGWHSSDTAELSFENVEATDACILGKIGDGWIQASGNLNWERLMLTLTALAGVRTCLKETIRYSRERKAFNSPIGKIPGVQGLLHKMQRQFLLDEALTHKALAEFISGRDCRAIVSSAKRQVCESALWIADRAIQIHGGYGYTTEFSSEQWWRDLRLMTIGGGTSEIMGNIVGKELHI